jgi:DNA processing protein
MDKAIRSKLILGQVPRLGGERLQHLLSLDSPDGICARSEADLFAMGLTSSQVKAIIYPNERHIEATLRWLSFSGQHCLFLGDSDYPPLLKQISSPPPLLFVKGQWTQLSSPQIAVVGSRTASLDALELATEFSRAFVRGGYAVTSGLALGVDGHAHLGALTENGQTMAVLGSGLASIYPKQHKGLAEKIVEQGALISEFFPHQPPKPSHFPRRNRVISGLSVGVLVVEAAEKSGSLITARYALEQGRDIFAIPSSIRDGLNQGNHRLIQSGAKLVMTPEDVFHEIGTLTEWTINHQITPSVVQNTAQVVDEELLFVNVLSTVGNRATPVDVIVQRSGLPVEDVMTQLLELELLDAVSAVSGGYVRTRRIKL